MEAKIDTKRRLIDFYDNGNWVEALTYEEASLFVNEITKLLNEAKYFTMTNKS